MLRLIAAALWLLASCSLPCLAEGLSDQDPALMTREQWQAHLKGLRERADVLRLQRRSFAPPPPPLQEELAEQASRRILEDESLQPGDVISTNRGLFRFQGSPNRERTPDDFVRIR
jgi:hypothetical protein